MDPDTDGLDVLFQAINAQCDRARTPLSGWVVDVDWPEAITFMIGGVSLNGRAYSQGSVCEYLPRVSRSLQNRVVGSSTSHRLGYINMFYRVYLKRRGDTGVNRRVRSEVFVDITDIPIIRKERGICIVSSIQRRVCQAGLRRKYDPTKGTVMHVDSVTSKVMLAPHYNPSLRNEYMCGIKMWLAR